METTNQKLSKICQLQNKFTITYFTSSLKKGKGYFMQQKLETCRVKKSLKITTLPCIHLVCKTRKLSQIHQKP